MPSIKKMGDRGSVELGNTDRNGLLIAAECKNSHSHDKKGEYVARAPAVKEENNSAGCADQMGLEVVDT